MAERTSLSIVLAATEPCADLANCLAVLVPQAEAVGGEVIVGEGYDGEAPGARAVGAGDHVRWIRVPGASVFELRARGAEAARGEIVALTEDHCVVGSDWCDQILDAFARNPDALAATGPVLNGATDRLIDWANFLHTFGAFSPPVNGAQRDRCPPAANVAYRRSAIGPGPIAPGWMELELSPRLFFDGRFCVSEGMTVTHVQSHGFIGTLAAHFHNGRSTTGLHRVPLTRRQLPWMQFRAALSSMSREARSAPAARASLPLMLLLSCCHAAGEVTGIVAGAGRSPAKLR